MATAVDTTAATAVDTTAAIAVSWNIGIVVVVFISSQSRALVFLLRGWENVYKLGGRARSSTVSAHFGGTVNNVDRSAEFVFTLYLSTVGTLNASQQRWNRCEALRFFPLPFSPVG